MHTDSDQAEERPVDAAVERQGEAMSKIGEALKSARVNQDELDAAVGEAVQAAEAVKQAMEERKGDVLTKNLGFARNDSE